MSLTSVLEAIFKEVIEKGDICKVDEYYDPHYTETINGKTRSLKEFKNTLKNRGENEEVLISHKEWLETGTTVGSIHELAILYYELDIPYKHFNVISVFEFTKDNRLSKCTEVVTPFVYESQK